MKEKEIKKFIEKQGSLGKAIALEAGAGGVVGGIAGYYKPEWIIDKEVIDTDPSKK